VTRAVVVGAGIAGLAAADTLARAGADVVVLEGSDAVGGKLRTGSIADVPVDLGAESFLRRRPEAIDLVAELGLAAELVAPVTTAASIWARGQRRPIPAGTVMGVPSRPGALRGLLSAAEVARAEADRVLPGSAPADEPGGDVAVGRWLRRRLGTAVVDRLVDPLLGGVYAGRADELSLAATLPQLPRDERSALAAARRAVPTGPSSGPVFASLPGGVGRLPTALADSLTGRDVDLRVRCAVRRLDRVRRRWRVTHGATVDEHVVHADAVVLAVPAAPAARLLADIAPDAARELSGIESASMAIVTTAWRGVDAVAVAGSGYLVPAMYGRPVKAVTYTSAKWPGHDADGVVLVRCSLGRHRDERDLQRDDADLADAAVRELTEHGGMQGRPVDTLVTRWGGGLPQYAVAHLERVERIRAAVAEVPGLAVCGAAYDGVGIPACIRTGRDAAESVLSQVSAPAAAD
jgi:oxygen-dependent protoporphyrinogen oxidase